MKLWITIAALMLAGCTTTPKPQPIADNDAILLVCEHALYAAANRSVTVDSASRAGFQDAFDVLDVMLDGPIKRSALCRALAPMGVADMIAPEGGLVRITPTDVFINERSISDEFVYDVANSFWIALNKFLNPTPKPEPKARPLIE